jgi:hypothetical protein
MSRRCPIRPHLESFFIRHGIDRDVRDCDFQRVGLYEKERNTPSIAGALSVCLFYFEE